MKKKVWEKNEVQEILKQRADGMTFLVIAQLHNTTRSAIAGLISRKTKGQQRPYNGFAKTVLVQRLMERQRPRITKTPASIKETIAPPIAPADYPSAASFLELEKHQCKWQVQDEPRMFCGGVKSSKAYCEYHQWLSLRKTTEPATPKNLGFGKW